jgi:hypothetical protein
LFIFLPFPAVRLPNTDDSDAILPVCVRDYQELTPVVLGEQEESLLLKGVVGVRNGDGEQVNESRDRSLNGTPCFLWFASSLAGSHSKVAPMCRVYTSGCCAGAPRSVAVELSRLDRRERSA